LWTLYLRLTPKMWRKCGMNQLSRYLLLEITLGPFWQGLCCIHNLVKRIILSFWLLTWYNIKGIQYRDFLFLSKHAWHRILDMFFVKHTNWSNETIRILKTDLTLSSKSTTNRIFHIFEFLILTSPKIEIWQFLL